MLESLVDKGYRVSEAFRMALRTFAKKEFPLYTPAGKALVRSDISNEDYCVEKGGEVIEEDDQVLCQLVNGGMTTKVLLEMVKERI